MWLLIHVRMTVNAFVFIFSYVYSCVWINKLVNTINITGDTMYDQIECKGWSCCIELLLVLNMTSIPISGLIIALHRHHFQSHLFISQKMKTIQLKTNEINDGWLLVILWHINPCRLFNPKYYFHIRYQLGIIKIGKNFSRIYIYIYIYIYRERERERTRLLNSLYLHSI